MHSANLRNQLAVHRVQVVAVALLLTSFAAEAQLFRWARQNNPNYDERRFSYGFNIGVHTSAYQIEYSDKFVTKDYDTLNSVMAPWSPGFSVGFLVNLRLADFFDLRLMPTAAFYDHKLRYRFTDFSEQEQIVSTTMVEFPLLVKYKSQRRGNVRMYVVGGGKPAFEASGKNDIGSATSSLSIRAFNMSLEAGMGFDFYYPLFKFSPEIRFSKGIYNMLGDQSDYYSDALSRISTNTVSVYFIFQ
jgi:hypothetical protein